MCRVLTKIYNNKEYEFPWGFVHNTFVQFIDGSKAALDTDNHKYYWIYFSSGDVEYTKPIKMLEMTQGELDELDYVDIIKDLSDANQRGMYPEVSQKIRVILQERSVRREVIYILNSLNEHLIKEHPGIVYYVSRKALESMKNNIGQQIAISLAIHSFLGSNE